MPVSMRIEDARGGLCDGIAQGASLVDEPTAQRSSMAHPLITSIPRPGSRTITLKRRIFTSYGRHVEASCREKVRHGAGEVTEPIIAAGVRIQRQLRAIESRASWRLRSAGEEFQIVDIRT